MKSRIRLFAMGLGALAVATAVFLWLRHRRAESEFYSFTTIRPVTDVKPYADVRWKDLSSLDLREKPELIPTLWFNGATVWPHPSRMPAGVNPGLILTNGMDPGLGVRELHRQGITGKGVVVAVIDAPTGFDHPEYRGKVIRSTSIKTDASVSMHGPAVLSLLVGDRCGTAPGAKVYYVASSNVTEGVDWILQQNRQLPAGERIRAVSVSQEQDETWREACQRAEAEDVLIVDLNQVHGWVAPCQLGKDRGDPGQCTPLESRGQTNFFAGRLRVPTAPRTCAESYRVGEYSYHHNGQRQWTQGIHGVSWAPPYCTGVLALGWQVRPDVSGRKMRELLFESAYVSADGQRVINPPAFIEAVRKATKTATQSPVGALQSTNGLQVLFIGNSQTWFLSPGCTNALPVLLEQMAQAKGTNLKCDVSQCRGGFGLQKHWELGKAQELIQSRRWDYVVLQEMVTTPIKNREEFFQTARLFHEVIRKANARTVLHLTSGPSKPDGRPDPKFQESLNAAYQDLARELDFVLAPVGPAWQEVARVNPDIRLFADNDFIHPSPTGSYLAACVFFGTLFHETPVGLPSKMTVRRVPWDFEVILGTARLRELQAVAWQCCREAGRNAGDPGRLSAGEERTTSPDAKTTP